MDILFIHNLIFCSFFIIYYISVKHNIKICKCKILWFDDIIYIFEFSFYMGFDHKNFLYYLLNMLFVIYTRSRQYYCVKLQ